MSGKPKILVVISSYLPGFKGGGPIRSLANLIGWLGEEFSFQVITADHDFKERTPYPGIETGAWLSVYGAQVMYLPSAQMSLGAWRKRLRDTSYDILYLISYFGVQTRRILLLRRLGMIPDRPVVLAPQGEFSPGALSLKRLKKRIYISCAMRLGLYRDLVWQASNEYEKQDIQLSLERFIPDLSRSIRVATDMSSPLRMNDSQDFRRSKRPDSLRIVFLSRIVRKKNLGYALQLLPAIRGDVVFDIYGTVEDRTYWEECKAMMGTMPSNIHVSYRGEVSPDRVYNVLSQYHLFLLPTRGENFGHVALEAMTAGCLVLISDQTPWRGLADKRVGWDISLSEGERFRGVLQRCAEMSNDEFSAWSNCATDYARRFVESQSISTLQSYRDLFAFEFNAERKDLSA